MLSNEPKASDTPFKTLHGNLSIRNGVANTPGALPALRMPGYAERISERDAWAIVAYLRALQATRQGELADVPEARRRELINTRPETIRNALQKMLREGGRSTVRS